MPPCPSGSSSTEPCLPLQPCASTQPRSASLKASSAGSSAEAMRRIGSASAPAGSSSSSKDAARGLERHWLCWAWMKSRTGGCSGRALMAGEAQADNGGRRGMATNDYTLVIGDKNFSSWSLRPWLALKHCRIPFTEERVRLRQPDSKAEILRHTPAGKVPVLKTEARSGLGQPRHPRVPRRAPSQSMASGRRMRRRGRRRAASPPRCMRASPRCATTCPWICLSRLPSPPISAALEADIKRIAAIWRETRARFGQGGPFLFGAFTNADAMYAPVVTRFRTYGVDLSRFGDDGTGAAYMDAIFVASGDGRVDRRGRRRSEGESRHLTGAVPRAQMVNTFLTPVPHSYSSETGTAGRLVASGKDWLTHGSRAKLGRPPAAQNGARAARHHGPSGAARRLHADRFAVRAERRAQAIRD